MAFHSSRRLRQLAAASATLTLAPTARRLENVLHEVTVDGGLGFCHAAVPELLPIGYHGPLVVAFDSNVLIDLQEYGGSLLNGEDLGVDEGYEEQLLALGSILDVWMLRDIRFIVTPRSRTDAKRLSKRFLATRGPAIDALAESLAFQYGDWSVAAPSDRKVAPIGSVTGIPDGADLDLLLEAQSVGAHAFLTRDEKVLTSAVLTGPALRILRPTEVADELVLSGSKLLEGGLCLTEHCPYREFSLPLPDLGKWRGVMSLFEEA